ncbi:MAG: hypothetical protein A2X86_18575 [Bdellovibrionales bacterium GWA2_49_15]|nr:MAG: hypothetical protein A2X86_18575 [Bdellovibrionales bacterium GWA2_49_15]
MGVNSEATKNRQVKRMDDALFRKIIDEMASVSYSGIVKFYCNNEALLDRRIVEFIEYTKEKLPHLTRLQIDTNGKLLTRELGASLFNAGLTCMLVDDYTETGGGGLNNKKEKIKEVYDWLREQFPDKTMGYFPRLLNEVLDSRAGMAPNNSYIPPAPTKASCVYPFYSMYITSNGNVAQCHYDSVFENPMGNVTSSSLQEVWQGEKFRQLRAGLLKCSRTNKLCTQCDFHGHINPLEIMENTHYLYNFAYKSLGTLAKIRQIMKSSKV